MEFEWDPEKDRSNRLKHGISFAEVVPLLEGGVDCLEIYDEAHSLDEDRFIAIGPIERGIAVVAFTERPDDVVRVISARMATPKERELFARYSRYKHG